MTNTPEEPTSLNRRKLLKLGLFGTVLLSTAGGIASLNGCSSDSPAQGYQQLRQSDLPMLRRIIPVVLSGSLPLADQEDTLQSVLRTLDNNLHHLSPSLNRQALQLFDVLTLGVTRGPLTGIWGRWENATDQGVRAFMQRWSDSTLGLLRQGHSALTNLVQLSYFTTPASWAQCGYPGPPRFGTGRTQHAHS